MLYKFKSAAAGDLVMLQANGRQVLEIIGKEPSASGIILPEQMQVAITALQTAIEQQEIDQKEVIAQALVRGDTPPVFPAIGLRKRAWPLMDMLQRCLREKAPITWGV